MPSFEAEFILRNGGDGGHVRFGHSYSFAAGYVYILMAALAGICLARLGQVILCRQRCRFSALKSVRRVQCGKLQPVPS